ncbi:hypothetical protein [Roseomonas indoligenes]|uniref:Uncharacterized protein n=1 Tax=Roseomonas indoligenes TaxID=2820811 RepID=A0A940S6U1_9PROT|nr:hypothetical protein [Pararoseomonas indoligenes]MBP0492358.1 hypothetical protein [Pararoseomonas indoligenes]
MLTTDPIPYAAFIVRHLLHPVGPRFGDRQAVAETEEMMDGDRWFWSDDNAKALEFLSLPKVWWAYPEAVEATFGFLRDLCRGPYVYRRLGQARLEAVENDGARARFVHSLMDITCDLPRGIVTVGVRFHDGRTARNVMLTGNYVRFTYAGIGHTLDVEDAIGAWEIRHRGDSLELSHASELRFAQHGRDLRLGRLVYAYRFDARSTIFRVEASLDLDPGVTVSDLVLTIAADDLTHGELGMVYNAVRARQPGAAPMRVGVTEPAEGLLPLAGAPYWSMSRDRFMRGFSPAIHSVPREPGRLSALNMVAREEGNLHWVAAEHAFPGERCGGLISAEETKLLTSGGFYDRVDDMAAIIGAEAAAPPSQPIDLSLSYDYGVELSAFARRARMLARAGEAAAPMVEEALGMHDQLLAAYEENMLAPAETDPRAIFSRPLSFVVMGLVDALAVTGSPRHREALRRAVDALLTFERPMKDMVGKPVSVFPMGKGKPPYLDCHAAAVLALARAATALDDPRIAPALDRALGTYALGTHAVDLGGPVKQDGVVIDVHDEAGNRHTHGSFWNYSAGLSLRGFAALRRSSRPELREVVARHKDRVELFETLMRRQVARSIRERGDALEIRTSVPSAESNSETQPWVAMGIIEDPCDDGPEAS